MSPLHAAILDLVAEHRYSTTLHAVAAWDHDHAMTGEVVRVR